MKRIKDFKNYYITKDGKVFNSKNTEICQWEDSLGYKMCILYKNKKKYYKRIHRLVAIAYLDNPKNLPQVNHIDGNKNNNNWNNLEWCTNSYNTQHGYDNEMYQFKERCHGVYVYDKEWNYLTCYKSIRETAKMLEINRKTLTRILKREKNNNYKYNFKYAKES